MKKISTKILLLEKKYQKLLPLLGEKKWIKKTSFLNNFLTTGETLQCCNNDEKNVKKITTNYCLYLGGKKKTFFMLFSKKSKTTL